MIGKHKEDVFASSFLDEATTDEIIGIYNKVNACYPPIETSHRKIFEPKANSPLYVAAFSSNSGLVTRKALELQQQLKKDAGFSPFEITYLFSDNRKPKGTNPFFEYQSFERLADEYNIPISVSDIDQFYQEKGYENKKDPRLSKKDKLEIRKQFEKPVNEDMASADVGMVILDYYWSICTPEITGNYLTVNSHLGDLSVSDDKGRSLKGFFPVRKAIFLGHNELYSTTHIADEGIDSGDLLIRSMPIQMNIERDAKYIDVKIPEEDKIGFLKNPLNDDSLNLIEDFYEACMRRRCDSFILPLTILMISEGRFAKDDDGRIYFNGHRMEPVLKL